MPIAERRPRPVRTSGAAFSVLSAQFCSPLSAPLISQRYTRSSDAFRVNSTRFNYVSPRLRPGPLPPSISCAELDLPVQQQNNNNTEKQKSVRDKLRVLPNLSLSERNPRSDSAKVPPTNKPTSSDGKSDDARYLNPSNSTKNDQTSNLKNDTSKSRDVKREQYNNVLPNEQRRQSRNPSSKSRPSGLFPQRRTITRRKPPGKEPENDFTKLYGGTTEERASFVQDLRDGCETLGVGQFCQVIKMLNRQRRTDDALDVVQFAESGPMADRLLTAKSVKAFTMMIDVYGKAYQLSRAFSMFYGMARNGIPPNVVTYNTMIAACSRSNEPDLAYEVFEEMQGSNLEPDKFTFGSLIDSCAKCGKVDRAFEISELMDRKGVEKDQTIYSALMDACGRTEQLERALMVFEEMKRKGIWPNLVTFSVLIDMCANSKKPERAFHLYSELKHWGYPSANVIVFTALIDACAKSGWPERGEKVLKTMLENRVQPNQITFGALMEGWARKGELDRAFEVMERMVKTHNVLPNAVLMGGLIEACRRQREFWHVVKLWEIIARYNLLPSKMYYPCLIGMAVVRGDVKLSTAIVLHAYARGILRRAALKSGNPALRAIACAMVYYRHEFIKKSGNGVVSFKTSVRRVSTAFMSMAMTKEEMDGMSVVEARDFCLSWGDPESKTGYLGARLRNGSRKDRKGVYRKESSLSVAAKWAKDAAAGNGLQRQ